ncbi:MAG: PadR family transcriptional regulator [Pseudomonadales bacterium]|nr:PadR family transcriptional regulator [Pseudomonadales bacterium]
MSLKHTILAMLETGEITGYGIAKKFNGTFGFFWNASHQQIYQELAKLAKIGLVDYQSITQSGKPNKKIYRITATGLQELKKWIEVPMELPKIKDQLMVKLIVGHLVKPEVLQNQIKRHEVLHQEKLDTLYELTLRTSGNNSINKKLARLALKRGMALHQSWLQWATEVQEVLAELEESINSTTEEITVLPDDTWMLETTD